MTCLGINFIRIEKPNDVCDAVGSMCAFSTCTDTVMHCYPVTPDPQRSTGMRVDAWDYSCGTTTDPGYCPGYFDNYLSGPHDQGASGCCDSPDKVWCCPTNAGVQVCACHDPDVAIESCSATSVIPFSSSTSASSSTTSPISDTTSVTSSPSSSFTTSTYMPLITVSSETTSPPLSTAEIAGISIGSIAGAAIVVAVLIFILGKFGIIRKGEKAKQHQITQGVTEENKRPGVWYDEGLHAVDPNENKHAGTMEYGTEQVQEQGHAQPWVGNGVELDGYESPRVDISGN